MRLTDDALGRHVYVLGGTGTGKSRALETWFMQLAKRGEGVGVMDPHGELYNNLVARLAGLRDRRVWERVVLVNPLDSDFAVGFNPLQVATGEVVQRKMRFLADVITTIWRADPLITARMQRMMMMAFWLLSETGLTLRELAVVLTDPEFRGRLLAPFPYGSPLRQYWEYEFPSNPKTAKEWVQSTLNKAGSLTIDPDLELFFGQQSSTIDFRAILDEGKILLVNLSKGGLVSSSTSHTLGAFILAQIQQSAFARENAPASSRRRFTLFLDEFQNYTTADIQEILTETRKYQLSVIMAHQFYEQLQDSPKLQAAVVSTVGNIATFRIGYSDALVFLRDIFEPDIDQVKDIRVRYQKVPTLFGEVTRRFEEPIYRSQNEIWDAQARMLTQLKNREFWYKQRGNSGARKYRSLTLADVEETPQLEQARAELVALSNRRWARPKRLVRSEIEERDRGLFGGDDGAAPPEADSPPLWGT